MPPLPHANHDASVSPVIVTNAGLIHPRDRAEIALLGKQKSGKYPVLISSTHIQHRIAELARKIVLETHKNNIKEIHFLIVLKGAAFFGCRLAQEIFRMGGPNVVLQFVNASSYGKSMRSRGSCRITGKLNMLRGKDVIVVEDICDTGLTLDQIKQRLLKKELAASVITCVLLDKPGNRLARLKKTPIADFIGFQIPEIFVAGFGLEYIEHYRELPFIVAVQDKLIELN